MAKNILAFLGMIFLILLVGGSILLIGNIYQAIGLVRLPEGLAEAPQAFIDALTADEVQITGSAGKVEWRNPLEPLPEASPTFFPTLAPTSAPTPVPPLTQAEYRGRAMAALKAFVAAVERWLDTNERLTLDMSLMQDTAWREETRMSLDQIAFTAQALSAVGPPPSEYSEIDVRLDQVAFEALGLQQNYRSGLETGEMQSLIAAGENFIRIKEVLTQAVELMVAAGWSIE